MTYDTHPSVGGCRALVEAYELADEATFRGDFLRALDAYGRAVHEATLEELLPLPYRFSSMCRVDHPIVGFNAGEWNDWECPVCTPPASSHPRRQQRGRKCSTVTRKR